MLVKQTPWVRAAQSPALLPSLMLLFIALRAVCIILVPVAPTFDSAWYLDRAVGLSQGLGFTDDGRPTAFWPPGYSAFLAALFAVFGAKLWVALAANVVLGAGLCFLLYRLSIAIFGDRLAAAIGVGALALYPNQIAYTLGVSTEVIYPFMIMLASLILSRGSRMLNLFGFGLVMGCATLIKAQTLLLPLLFVLVLDAKSLALRELIRCSGRVLVVYLGVGLIVVPWTARNYAAFGAIVPVSTNGGVNLLNGNNPFTQGDFTPDEILARLWQREPGEDEVAADRRAGKIAADWIRENPLAFATLMPKKVWRLWAIDGEAEWSIRAGYRRFDEYASVFHAIRWADEVYYLLLMATSAGAVAALWRSRRLWHSLAAVPPMMAAYTTVIAMLFSGQARYHHFLMPWAALYAGWVVARLVAVGRLTPAGAASPVPGDD